MGREKKRGGESGVNERKRNMRKMKEVKRVKSEERTNGKRKKRCE